MNLTPSKDLNTPEAIINHVMSNIIEKKTLKSIISVSFSGATNFIYMGDYQSAPAAAVAYRGYLIYIKGAAGVADTIKCCMKAAANTYSWVTVATA